MKMSKTLTIAQIKKRLAEIPTEEEVAIFQQDERKGVQQALKSYFNRLAKDEERRLKHEEMLAYERQYLAEGFHYVAGIDEVGRGPLAGPVVAAAVILPPDVNLLGLNDSKQLSEQKRKTLLAEIKEQAISIGIGVVEADEIDRINIYQASKVAMAQAVENLKQQPDCLLIDAMTIEQLPIRQEAIIKGDQKSLSIAAASVVAKEYRDDLMRQYGQAYPGYDFEHNVGYGTRHHLEGIEKYGITPIHRRTFAPIKNMI